MAKKYQEFEVSEEPEVVTLEEVEPLFEAEAYGTPQPEAGSDVTVMKQVGIGGPVPIVAPKHNTIQLQPIVVPLAVVPYMTQDSNILRTDTRATGGYETDEDYREGVEFDTERTKEAKKKKGVSWVRILSLITFILSALTVLPFFLSEATDNLGSMVIKDFNVIQIMRGWIAGGFMKSSADAINLVYFIVMCLVGIQTILTLLGVVIGKYPKPITPILSFITMGAFIGLLIYKIVSHSFAVKDEVGFLVLLVLSVLTFVLSLVFSILLNYREDKQEQKARKGAEI